MKYIYTLVLLTFLTLPFYHSVVGLTNNDHQIENRTSSIYREIPLPGIGHDEIIQQNNRMRMKYLSPFSPAHDNTVTYTYTMPRSARWLDEIMSHTTGSLNHDPTTLIPYAHTIQKFDTSSMLASGSNRVLHIGTPYRENIVSSYNLLYPDPNIDTGNYTLTYETSQMFDCPADMSRSSFFTKLLTQIQILDHTYIGEARLSIHYIDKINLSLRIITNVRHCLRQGKRIQYTYHLDRDRKTRTLYTPYTWDDSIPHTLPHQIPLGALDRQTVFGYNRNLYLIYTEPYKNNITNTWPYYNTGHVFHNGTYITSVGYRGAPKGPSYDLIAIENMVAIIYAPTDLQDPNDPGRGNYDIYRDNKRISQQYNLDAAYQPFGYSGHIGWIADKNSQKSIWFDGKQISKNFDTLDVFMPDADVSRTTPFQIDANGILLTMGRRGETWYIIEIDLSSYTSS